MKTTPAKAEITKIGTVDADGRICDFEFYFPPGISGIGQDIPNNLCCGWTVEELREVAKSPRS